MTPSRELVEAAKRVIRADEKIKQAEREYRAACRAAEAHPEWTTVGEPAKRWYEAERIARAELAKEEA